MSALNQTEVHDAHATDRRAPDEGPELVVPYSTTDADMEAANAREKKTGSPKLESYGDEHSDSHVGSVRRDGEIEKTKWEWGLSHIYRRFRPLFHLAFWMVWTA